MKTELELGYACQSCDRTDVTVDHYLEADVALCQDCYEPLGRFFRYDLTSEGIRRTEQMLRMMYLWLEANPPTTLH